MSRKEVKTILDDCINDVGDTKGIKIVFTFFKDDFMKSVNAGAKVLFLPKQIWVNSEWAAHLTYNQHNKNTWNAFLITVGHELTHKEKEFSVRGLKNNDKQFVLYKLQY